MRNVIQTFSRVAQIPTGHTSGKITEGCLILEGGAWRGMYTSGVLDALMSADITFRTVIGVSAGALCGISYVSGQMGYAARINLSYRQDPNYVGIRPMIQDGGITGFTYMYRDLPQIYPLNLERLYRRDTRFYAVATNVITGKPRFFEKSECMDKGLDFFTAIQASATVPYVSEPVMIDNGPYLDGGCAVNIPYTWARENFPGKIVVVKTRDASYVPKLKKLNRIDHRLYDAYPEFQKAMVAASVEYKLTLQRLREDEEAGKIFVFQPYEPVKVKRFEKNMERLGELYESGLREGKEQLPRLKEYLEA